MYRANKKTSKKSKKITGVFKSEVTKFYYENKHHIPDTYLIVEYKLTDESGAEYEYKESFLDNGRNDRADDFFYYLEENGITADVIFACGPMPMLRAIKRYAEAVQIPAYISLEEHMACGVGACLGCVVKTKEVDHHSHVHNARICTDGPVFDAEEVDI